MIIDRDDNELIALEVIQKLVDALDDHFENVCERDIIFNCVESYYVVNEVVNNGHMFERADFGTEKHLMNQHFMQLTNHSSSPNSQNCTNSSVSHTAGTLSTPVYSYQAYLMNSPYAYSGVNPYRHGFPSFHR